jgi:hypothetical protein
VTDLEYDDKGVKKEHPTLLKSVQVDIVMAHVRAATKGVVCDSNAHPFNLTNIVGAHNGTLRDKKYEHATKTDSEQMFRDIQAHGLAHVLKELDPKSAYAISMYNRTDRCMYFARNEERTLSIAFLENRSVMYWASDLEMLKFTLDRNKEPYKAYSFKPHKIIKIDANDITYSAIKHDPLDILQVIESLREDKPKETPKPKDEPPFVPTGKVDNNVLAFPKQQAITTKAFHADCVCGKKHLNLLEINYAQRGKLTGVRYENGKYHCTNCEVLEFKREIESVIG